MMAKNVIKQEFQSKVIEVKTLEHALRTESMFNINIEGLGKEIFGSEKKKGRILKKMPVKKLGMIDEYLLRLKRGFDNYVIKIAEWGTKMGITVIDYTLTTANAMLKIYQNLTN